MRRILANRSFTDILVSGSGSMFAPVINFSAIPFVMRIYGPEEYGSWMLIMSIAIILGNVSTFRYDLAIVLAEDEREAGQIFALCVTLMAFVTGIAFLVVALKPLWLNFLPALLDVQEYLWLVPIFTFLIGMGWSGRSFCTRERAFAFNSMSFVVFAIFTNGTQIFSPSLGLDGCSGLLAGSIMGWATAIVVLLWGIIRNSGREFWGGFFRPQLLLRAKEYGNFPRFSVPYTIVGTLRLEGVKLMLGSAGNSALVGDFSFAQRLTNFPVTLFCGGIRPVLYQKAARAQNAPELEFFIRRIVLVLILISLPLVIFFVFNTEAIFRIVVGEKWIGAIPYARILVLPAFGMMMTGWLDRLFDVKGRQDLALFFQILFTAVGLLGFGIGWFLMGSPILAVSIQSLVTLFHGLVTLVVVYRLFGFPLSRLWSVVLFLVLMAVLVFIPWGLMNSVLSDWMGLGIGIGFSWLAGIYILRRFFFPRTELSI